MPGPGTSIQSDPRRRHRNPEAGGFSSFTLKLNREDGDQFLGHLNFTMPPGLTANLHGVTYCPEASISQAAADPRPHRAGTTQVALQLLKLAPLTSPLDPGNTLSTP